MGYLIVIGANSEAPLYLSQVRLDGMKVKAICFGQREAALCFSTAEVADMTADIVEIFLTSHIVVSILQI
jgi:hypothetical protein